MGLTGAGAARRFEYTGDVSSDSFLAEGRRSVAARREEQAITLCDAMIEVTAAIFDVPTRELRRPGRSTLSVARIRQVAMYVAHVVLELSMSEVGRGFQRDRTTVLYACHQIEDMRDDDDFDAIVVTVERVARAAFGILEARRR